MRIVKGAAALWISLALVSGCQPEGEPAAAPDPQIGLDDDGVLYGGAGDAGDAGDPRGDIGPQQGLTANEVLSEWRGTSKRVGRRMLHRYGEPDELTNSLLVWRDTGEFAFTLVFRDGVQHDFPMPHQDVLQQVVYYDVPPELFDDLAMFDGSVIAERTKGSLSARCDSEAGNRLALNLAHQIVTGEIDWQEAREEYGNVIVADRNGEPAPLMDELVFEPSRRNQVGDPDVSTIDLENPGGGPLD